MTNTVLSPPLLTVASGNTHPSPGRAAGDMAITFSPVDLYFLGQPQTQCWWCSLRRLFLMAIISKMFLVVANWEDVHLYCVGMWADTRANVQVVLSPWADRISLTLQRSLNVFVKNAELACFNCLQSHLKRMHLIFPFLCFNKVCRPAYHEGSDFFVK